jgi:copper transport protein
MCRSGGRSVIVMLVMVAASLWFAAPAHAHASLESSTPGAFAVLESSPPDLRLRFSEAPQAGFTTLRLVDADTREQPLGPVTAAPDDPRTVTASVGELSPGWYGVVWSVVSVDGHRVTGSFAFSVGVAGTGTARDLLGRLASQQRSDAALDTVVVAVKVWGFAGLALLLGGGWVRHGTGAARHAPARLDHLVWLGWGWTLTATVSLFPLLAAQASGGALADVVDPSRWVDLADSRQGQALVARVVVLGMAAWLVARGPHGRQRRSWHPTAAVVGFALALTHTVGGHGSTARWAWLAVVVAAVHLAAVTGWMGAVATVAVGGRQWQRGPADALTVVAPLARTAAPLAVVSGVVMTLLVGPSPGDLLDTRWGRLLVAKVLVVTVLIAVGAALGRVAHHTPARRRRLLSAELMLGGVTLVVAGALISTPPTTPAIIEPVTTTLVQAGVLAEVTITPARVGVNELHLVMNPPGGSLQPVGQVSARLVPVGRELPPFAVDVAVAGVNHWTAPLQFPYAGRWELEIVAEVRPLEVARYVTEFVINR